MSPFEYQLTFVAIILGLGITDMLESVHKLLTSPTKWHWMPPLWAVAVFATILAMWIFNFSIEGSTDPLRYLRSSAISALLYLLSSAALPDSEGDGTETNLQEYFHDRARYLGVLWLGFYILAMWTLIRITGWFSPEWWLVATGLVAVLPCVFSRRVWLHTVAMLAVIGSSGLIMFGGAS